MMCGWRLRWAKRRKPAKQFDQDSHRNRQQTPVKEAGNEANQGLAILHASDDSSMAAKKVSRRFVEKPTTKGL